MWLRTGLVLGLLLVLGASGCGQAADNGLPESKDTGDGVKFARCMRDNGVPDFPDPKPNGNGGLAIEVPEGVSREEVDAAMQKCRQYLPNGGEPEKVDPAAIEQQRKLSQCMRDNGVPGFPDPKEGGGIDIEGVDPADPTFKEAEQKCSQFRPPGAGTNTRNG
ncbi:MAG TPA: hypothetical protein DGG94_10100 [Micromonosporaceae bacterium]|nr:hypothetical protein [Micromonosporaceae bacterium]HCU50134.1 hypothetical protein [Micromonosporaceae bacterium]